MSNFTLVMLYSGFAAVATCVNLITQAVLTEVYRGPLAYFVALVSGTLAGLIVKYILDKRYIFHFVSQSAKQDAQKFTIYTIMGVATTAIFWGTQTFFYLAIPEAWAKYVGAVIGLSIGYFVKYQLDKRFVFKHHDQTQQ